MKIQFHLQRLTLNLEKKNTHCINIMGGGLYAIPRSTYWFLVLIQFMAVRRGPTAPGSDSLWLQKVHRSWGWLSPLSLLPAAASELWPCRVVESSPFKLFLHTGQVSCSSNQGTMQLLWKKWLQGSCRTFSSTV